MSVCWICSLNYSPKCKARAFLLLQSRLRRQVVVFWHSSSSPSQLHRSVLQTRLLDLQEDWREHVLLLDWTLLREELQLHLTSCRTASGTGGSLLSTGSSLSLSFRHTCVNGSDVVACVTDHKVWHEMFACRCARRMCSRHTPGVMVNGKWLPDFIKRLKASA